MSDEIRFRPKGYPEFGSMEEAAAWATEVVRSKRAPETRIFVEGRPAAVTVKGSEIKINQDNEAVNLGNPEQSAFADELVAAAQGTAIPERTTVCVQGGGDSMLAMIFDRLDRIKLWEDAGPKADILQQFKAWLGKRRAP